MWKYASRSIKSVFCKQQCPHNNVWTRESRNDKGFKCFRRLSPAFFGHSNRSYGSESQKGPFTQNDKENPNADKKNFLNDLPHFLSVLSWSGLCVLGVYIIQPFSQRKVTFNQKQSGKCAFDIFSRYTQNDYLQLVNYFTSFQPIFHVLPTVEATKPKNKDGKYDSEVNGIEFDKLEKAHRSVIGSISNFHGADCMTKGKYSEAILHFEEAAQVKNPSGMYNLGVCYEIGLGTNQDYKKAAEMYKGASDLGHPTATYNLGVFYVHGLGDLETDLNKARNLFQIAASQGQPDAQKALDMENNKVINGVIKSDLQVKFSKTENSVNPCEKHVELSFRKRRNFEKFGLFGDSFTKALKNVKAELKSASSDDSGALELDLSP